jgi:hypothetical protein
MSQLIDFLSGVALWAGEIAGKIAGDIFFYPRKKKRRRSKRK